MPVLWCGGEDIDFSIGNAPTVSTNSSSFRSYARCSVQVLSTGLCQSFPFSGGAVTSVWLTFRAYIVGNAGSFRQEVGLGLSTTGTGNGVYLGRVTNSNKLALYKVTAGTPTLLASESGTSFATSALHRLDMQISNYGATGVVNVYCDGTNVISYSGDLRTTGVTGFDEVLFTGIDTSGNDCMLLSEFMVADEDVRSWPGLQTNILTGAGTTSAWTGAYSTINAASFSDTSPLYTNATAQDAQFNVTDLPAGTYGVKAVKIVARAAASVGSTPTKIALGYNSGGSVAVSAAKTLTNAYATYEQLDIINPVTGVAFLQTEMNALQLDVRSVA